MGFRKEKDLRHTHLPNSHSSSYKSKPATCIFLIIPISDVYRFVLTTTILFHLILHTKSKMSNKASLFLQRGCSPITPSRPFLGDHLSLSVPLLLSHLSVMCPTPTPRSVPLSSIIDQTKQKLFQNHFKTTKFHFCPIPIHLVMNFFFQKCPKQELIF